MNNERMDYLLAYLSGLERLNSEGYRCNNEIDECIKWIREEFDPSFKPLRKLVGK